MSTSDIANVPNGIVGDVGLAADASGNLMNVGDGAMIGAAAARTRSETAVLSPARQFGWASIGEPFFWKRAH